jgi:hypothetical protein
MDFDAELEALLADLPEFAVPELAHDDLLQGLLNSYSAPSAPPSVLQPVVSVVRCLDPSHVESCAACLPAPDGPGWCLGTDGPKRLRTLLLQSPEWNSQDTLAATVSACVSRAASGSAVERASWHSLSTVLEHKQARHLTKEMCFSLCRVRWLPQLSQKREVLRRAQLWSYRSDLWYVKAAGMLRRKRAHSPEVAPPRTLALAIDAARGVPRSPHIIVFEGAELQAALAQLRASFLETVKLFQLRSTHAIAVKTQTGFFTPSSQKSFALVGDLFEIMAKDYLRQNVLLEQEAWSARVREACSNDGDSSDAEPNWMQSSLAAERSPAEAAVRVLEQIYFQGQTAINEYTAFLNSRADPMDALPAPLVSSLSEHQMANLALFTAVQNTIQLLQHQRSTSLAAYDYTARVALQHMTEFASGFAGAWQDRAQRIGELISMGIAPLRADLRRPAGDELKGLNRWIGTCLSTDQYKRVFNPILGENAVITLLSQQRSQTTC